MTTRGDALPIRAAVTAAVATISALAVADAVHVYDVDDYVQDGLVLHFDGIRNAGADVAHDATIRTWKNLVEGCPSATFTSDSNGYWVNGNGFYFEGRSKLCGARIDEAVMLGPNMTIQVAVDVDTAIQQSATTKGVYPAYFFGPSPDFGIYQGSWNAVTPTKLSFKHTATYSAGGSSDNNIAEWDGKYATAVLSENRSCLTQTTSLADGNARTVGTPTAQRFSWGCGVNDSGPIADRAVIGTFHSVRVYAKALTDAQLAHNRRVDEARFRSGDLGTLAYGNDIANVIVASNMEGLGGNEACGKWYIAEGTHTFTAPETVFAEGKGYVLNGYTIETWNADAGTWGEAVAHDGASYVADASSKVRLTWLWTLQLRGRNGYDVGDYVQDGLVLHFDGIRNVGVGIAHDPSATIWANLGSLGSAYDATKKALTSSVPSGAREGEWSDVGYSFKGMEYFALGSAVALGNEVTVQCIVDYDGMNQFGNWPMLFGATSANADDFAFYGCKGSSTLCFKLFRKASHDLNSWTPPYATAVYDDSNNRVSLGGSASPVWRNPSTGVTGDLSEMTYAIGAAQNSDANKAMRIFAGTNCSVRVYTNVLSEAQFALNRRIDEMRFFGKGDVVVVNAQTIEGATAMSSLPDGEYNIETEGWTFTARDIAANREFYRPVLSVEMLVDGEWVQMSQEQTYSYSVTVPISQRIRLTWSWKRHVGLTVFVR